MVRLELKATEASWLGCSVPSLTFMVQSPISLPFGDFVHPQSHRRRRQTIEQGVHLAKKNGRGVGPKSKVDGS